MNAATGTAPPSVLAYQARSSSSFFTGTLAHATGAWKHAAFMPGCALASHSPRLVKAVYGHLNRSLPGMGLLVQCCANPVLSVGDRESFGRYYGRLERELETHGLDTVVTACENCYMTLKGASTELRVLSLYNVLLEAGIPDRDYSAMPPAALHDPCPTRKERPLQDSVRQLLAGMRYSYEEFGLNRERTVCCGSGGMLELIDCDRALAMMRRRCSQTECGVIISYCQTCVESMGKGGKRGLHLLDLIFSETARPDFAQPAQGAVRRWINRYRSKRLVRLCRGPGGAR